MRLSQTSLSLEGEFFLIFPDHLGLSLLGLVAGACTLPCCVLVAAGGTLATLLGDGFLFDCFRLPILYTYQREFIRDIRFAWWR